MAAGKHFLGGADDRCGLVVGQQPEVAVDPCSGGLDGSQRT
jgi:hypothetical protein